MFLYLHNLNILNDVFYCRASCRYHYIHHLLFNPSKVLFYSKNSHHCQNRSFYDWTSRDYNSPKLRHNIRHVINLRLYSIDLNKPRFIHLYLEINTLVHLLLTFCTDINYPIGHWGDHNLHQRFLVLLGFFSTKKSQRMKKKIKKDEILNNYSMYTIALSIQSCYVPFFQFLSTYESCFLHH
jgi:hypothetical protein